MSAHSPTFVRSLNRGGLSTKIAGLVFWGMVLIGLLEAVALLHNEKQTQLARDGNQATRLVRHVAPLLKKAPESSVPLAAITAVFRAQRAHLGVEAMEIITPHAHIQLGTPSAHAHIVTRHVPWVSMTATAPRWIEVRVAFPSLHQAVTQRRHQLMLLFGLIMTAFGLILQLLLKRLLSRPFASLVAAAERFSAGDVTARMDESLADEFGYLAAFINRALDAGTAQQRDLQTALARAAVSEAALSLEKDRAELTLYAITDAVITINTAGYVQYMNPVAERLTGWYCAQATDALLDTVLCLEHESTGETLVNPGHTCLATPGAPTVLKNGLMVRPDGTRLAIELSAAAMRDAHGHVIGAVLVFQDVSHARQLAQQLSYQAKHDALTGLYNRLQFEQSLDSLLVQVQAKRTTHALLYLDMDQFKIVNDTCGHVAGDELLRQIARLLRADLRAGDVLARLGGDEFGVILLDCDLEQATRVAEALRLRVQHFRFTWENKTFAIGVSIGIVAITPDRGDVNGILSAADLSCYAAKDFGRNRIHVYRPTDAALTQRQGDMQWTNVIVDALKNNRFVLYQQPIARIGTHVQDTDCIEVLVRMVGVDGEIIAPARFIPAAERYNLMPQIDRWVIRETFRALSEAAYLTTMAGRMVSINLSATSLGDEKMLAFIRETATTFGIGFSGICFEITETVAISNWPLAQALIAELTGLGCRFALDDFGSGVSSFGYLKNLPVGFIKIDGHFVQNVKTDFVDRGIVEAITRMAHALQMMAIAEWVEDEETLQVLIELGVDFAQGNHITPPEPLMTGDSRPNVGV